MPQPRDASDLRRADDAALLAALGAGQPLALAEAYHRSVPAAHAVARRLMGATGAVEDLLLDVYTELWSDPPGDGPLEGWVRRTTWSLAAERLRADGRAPASPSAAALLPDLPAPEVRFLDAAERAIAELPDDERRALLLAHDRGTPSAAQDDGAEDALLQALLTLAGVEPTGADAEAMSADPCTDVRELGDLCLGLTDDLAGSEADEALRERPGCAATMRVARRGRRRIEGLPATPDLGQRILVTVLMAGGALPSAGAQPGAADDVPSSPAEDDVEGVDAGGVVVPLGGADPIEDTPTDDMPAEDEPFAPPADDGSPMVDTADLPQTGEEADALDPFDPEAADAAASDAAAAVAADVDTGSWQPGPGDATAELRLSDILADEGEEDDPFAGLDEDDDVPPPGPGTRDPYSALREVDEDAPTGPQGPISPAFAGPDPTPRSVPLPGEEEDLVDGYVEGQEEAYGPAATSRSGLAAVLAWVLPILGGSAIGILVAIQIFGLPG